MFNIKRIALALLLAIVLSQAGAMAAGCGSVPAKGSVKGPAGVNGPAKGPVVGPTINGSEAYHVIVAGGEPEGVAAALAAARSGAKTLLIEKGDALGGLMTLGRLNFLDMNHGPKGELLTRGVFEEFYKALGNAFDVEEAKAWFLRQCEAEPNLTVYLNTDIVKPVMVGDRIEGLEVSRAGAQETLRALSVIDATVDADVAAAAGVPYTVGGEDYGAANTLQGVTLVFEVSGVDWRAVTDYLKNDGNAGTGAEGNAAWGYGQEAQKYQPLDENTRFRGPNIARQKNNDVLLNALIIFGVDALDPDSYAEGIRRGLAEIPRVIEFIRENFRGFENAAFVSAAPRLYVRETRHIQGEYRLTITDVLENRDHWDRIGHGSYPVDIQPTGPGNYGNIIGVPAIYSIPFRCLVPLRIDGLLVAGRGASYDSIPHGSARVIPIGMMTGQACGVAAAYATRESVSFREMSADKKAIEELQSLLKKQGAYLTEYTPPKMAVMSHWAYSGVVVMRELGLTEGGYNNDYRLEKPLPNRWALQNKLNKLMSLARARTASRDTGQVSAWEISLPDDESPLGRALLETARAASLGDRRWLDTRLDARGGAPAKPGDGQAGQAGQAGQTGQVGQAGPVTAKDFADAEQARLYLIELGILDKAEEKYFSDTEATADYGQLLYLLGRLYTFLVS